MTSSFPYEGGEQFFESEVIFWEATRFRKIYFLPNKRNGKLRSFPKNIELINVSEHSKLVKFPLLGKILFSFLAFFNSNLYREIIYLILNRSDSIKFINFYRLYKSCVVLEKEKHKLKLAVMLMDSPPIVYSYWNSVGSYAACLLKKKGVVRKVFSRAHGFDLYEERMPENYMPLKRQFVNDIDKVFLLSESAIEYYHEKYSAKRSKLALGRLGVFLPEILPVYQYNRGELRVLSVSYCVSVKRIDKIIIALKHFTKKNPTMNVTWTHIGFGPLYNDFIEKLKSIDLPNFYFELPGELSNKEVLKRLKLNNFDIFVNASESEGVPVSIMEAMAFGVPTIAPDVGGIADLVCNDSGYLMPAECTPEDITKGIEWIISEDHIFDFRIKARQKVYENFNAEKNYPLFVKKLESSTAETV